MYILTFVQMHTANVLFATYVETLSKRKEKAKNDIILRALSEFSDLEALRSEKRAIMEEEQRLRALLALEKTTVNKKADRQAAVRAQRQRKDAKAQYRRQKYRDSLDQVLEEEGKKKILFTDYHFTTFFTYPNLAILPTIEYHVKKRFDLLIDPKHPKFEIIPESSERFNKPPKF